MTDNIVWSTLENAISMGGRRATLRKPSVSLPRPLRGLGHITSGYLASCHRHFAQIQLDGWTPDILKTLCGIAFKEKNKGNYRLKCTLVGKGGY